MTFGAEFAAALTQKVYDPVAWAALLGGLVLGAVARRNTWTMALGWGVLAFTVLVLAQTYSAPLARGDSAAFAVICAVGALVGQQLVKLLKRRSRSTSSSHPFDPNGEGVCGGDGGAVVSPRWKQRGVWNQ